MKKILTLIAITATVALTGCNTVKGMGQDMQKAGTAIEDAAKKK